MESYLSAEDKARVEIDKMLEAAGWAVQDARDANLAAARGVAVREFILEPPHGRADYLLFLDREAVGVIEAKPEGATLTGVEWQSAKYLDGVPDWVTSALEGALPCAYQSTGVETRFTNTLDPEARSRQVFWFHRPETLADWIREVHENPLAPTLRHRLTKLPVLNEDGLWPAQATAIRNLERSLAENRPRALIQMATGAGKTYTAANVAYRAVKHAGARRVLFLVDRANLGRGSPFPPSVVSRRPGSGRGGSRRRSALCASNRLCVRRGDLRIASPAADRQPHQQRRCTCDPAHRILLLDRPDPRIEPTRPAEGRPRAPRACAAELDSPKETS